MNEWLDGNIYTVGWMNDECRSNVQNKLIRHRYLPIKIDAGYLKIQPKSYVLNVSLGWMEHSSEKEGQVKTLKSEIRGSCSEKT